MVNGSEIKGCSSDPTAICDYSGGPMQAGVQGHGPRYLVASDSVVVTNTKNRPILRWPGVPRPTRCTHTAIATCKMKIACRIHVSWGELDHGRHMITLLIADTVVIRQHGRELGKEQSQPHSCRATRLHVMLYCGTPSAFVHSAGEVMEKR